MSKILNRQFAKPSIFFSALFIIVIIIILNSRNFKETIKMPSEIDSCFASYDSRFLRIKLFLNNDTIGYWFSFDTGSDISMIDNSLIEKYNLKKEGGGAEITDAYLTSKKLDKYKVENLIIGNSEFNNFSFYSFERKEQGYGIIGANIIRKLNWGLVHKKNILYFSIREFDTARIDNNYTILPFKISEFSGSPKIKVSIGNIIIDDVILDTGYDLGLVLPINNHYNSLQNNKSIIITESYGIQGNGIFEQIPQKSIVTHGLKLKLGTYTIPYSQIHFLENTLKLLGNDILDDFIILLNYSQKNVIFIEDSKIKQENKLIVLNNDYGLDLWLKNEKIIIKRIITNSPADKANLKYGDEILTINGKKYNNEFGDFNLWISKILQAKTLDIDIKNKGKFYLEYAQSFQKNTKTR